MYATCAHNNVTNIRRGEAERIFALICTSCGNSYIIQSLQSTIFRQVSLFTEKHSTFTIFFSHTATKISISVFRHRDTTPQHVLFIFPIWEDSLIRKGDLLLSFFPFFFSSFLFPFKFDVNFSYMNTTASCEIHTFTPHSFFPSTVCSSVFCYLT